MVAPFGAGQNNPQAAAQTPSVPSTTTRGRTEGGGGAWTGIPEMTTGMTYREIGSSGLRAFSGWVREEFLPELVGRQGARAYREMMDSNATIGGIMFSIISTMRKVEWRVMAPKNGTENQEMIDFVESLKDDMSHTWEELMTENLSMLGFGFAPHEIVYKKRLGRDPGPDPDRPGHDLPKSRYSDGRIGWRRIPLRGQDTVIKWFFDENGMVKGMTQQPWIGPLIDIPIEKMLLFRPTFFKGNPEGRSVLRSAYRAYFFTKRIQEQEAILFERMNGLPIMYVPNDLIEAARTDSNAASSLDSFKKIVTNVRIDEQMGVLLPSNTFQNADGSYSNVKMFELLYRTPEGKGAGAGINSKDVLDRYSVDMMTTVLADFLHLGHASRGTQALADQKADMFYQAVEGFLNANAAVYNRHALPRLWDLNGWDHDNMPTIEPDLAQRVDLDILSNFVLRLAQAGMPMFPNEDLQSYLLDAGGMPDVTDPAAAEFAGMTPELIDSKTETTLNPPAVEQQPFGGGSNTEKMIKASLVRRMVKYAGNRFDIDTRRPVQRHKRARSKNTRAMRIKAYTNGHEARS